MDLNKKLTKDMFVGDDPFFIGWTYKEKEVVGIMVDTFTYGIYTVNVTRHLWNEASKTAGDVINECKEHNIDIKLRSSA